MMPIEQSSLPRLLFGIPILALLVLSGRLVCAGLGERFLGGVREDVEHFHNS